MFDAFKGWTSAQKHVVAASFLGWTLDAFDFFLMVFVIKDVAHSFGVDVGSIALAITFTLALRPVGAFVFGRLADRFGRRPVLMADVALYSVLGFATAFTPSLIAFLVVRSLFGIAMGGEWGTGASLTMETVPAKARGLVSGLLQSGYPTGYLLASIVYRNFYGHFGAWTGMEAWRVMFMIGIVPALLILYIRRNVPESPGWQARQDKPAPPRQPLRSWEIAGLAVIVLLSLAEIARRWAAFGWLAILDIGVPVGMLLVLLLSPVIRRNWGLALYAIALMTAFNFFSHGTQDIYPTFLQVQHKFDVHTTGNIAILYNIGAILGGWTFGIWSQSFGRRRAIVVASLLAIPVAYLWAYSETATMLAVGAFLMQFFVQGAWGVVPAHLNELSPADTRGTFPGTVYQLGNFIASSNAVLQVGIASRHGGNYSLALFGVAVAAAIVIAILTALGREAREADLTV